MISGDAPVILVVDDHEPIRDLICHVLKRAGFAVLEADGGAAALRLAAGSERTIALLLTDISMPGMDGNELIERFTKLYPDAKVLIVTADLTLLRPGPHPVLLKPLEPDHLVRTIKEILTGLAVSAS